MLKCKNFYLFWAILFVGMLAYGKESALEKCERLQKEKQEYATQIEQSPTPLPKIVKKMNALQKELDQCSAFIKRLEQKIPCENIFPYVNSEDGRYYFVGMRLRYKTGKTPDFSNEKLSWDDTTKLEGMRYAACLPYWEENPTIDKCKWLHEKIQRYNYILEYNSEYHPQAKEELAKFQKEFDKCSRVIQSFEKEMPCDAFIPTVGTTGEYTHGIGTKVFQDGKKPQIPDERLDPEERGSMELLRFYTCARQWEEEDRLAEEERQRQAELEKQRQIEKKEKRTADYFAKCPKGITSTSFDCYRMNKKFINYGFRGNEFTQWSDEEVYRLMDYYPTDTQIYETQDDGGYMKVTVSHGIIVGMTVGFPPSEGDQEAIHLTIKKKFPNLKENSRGAIVAKTGGIEFKAYKDGRAYTIDYDSSLREEMRKKEELEELKKETQKASTLF